VYGKILGIKLPEEEHLLYIAKECLLRETPPEWQCRETETGQIVYMNKKSGVVTSEHPNDAIYKAKVVAERKKIYENNKRGMVKISLPKSKASFVENIFSRHK
jgi:hypothetical protein